MFFLCVPEWLFSGFVVRSADDGFCVVRRFGFVPWFVFVPGFGFVLGFGFVPGVPGVWPKAAGIPAKANVKINAALFIVPL